MEKLVAVAELGVEDERGGDAKTRERKRGGTRVPPEQDQKAARELDRERERQQHARHAERLAVANGGRIGGELAPGLVQEQRGNEEAAGERRRLHDGLRHRHTQLTLAAVAIACSRSLSSSQPPGQRRLSAATFCLAFSISPVST